MIDYEQIKIKINGVVLPVPTTWQLSYEDLDSEDSLRDVKHGVMHRMRIRNDVLKISLGYTLEDMEIVSQVMRMLSPAEFTVETLDIKTLQRKSFTMFCNKKKLKAIPVGNGIYSQGYSFDLTEC